MRGGRRHSRQEVDDRSQGVTVHCERSAGRKRRAAGQEERKGVQALEGQVLRVGVLSRSEKTPNAPTVLKKGYIRYHRSSREEVH